MKKLKYLLIISVCLGFGILIGLIIKPKSLATILITNTSGKKIEKVYVTSEDSITYYVENIAQQKTKEIKIYVAGESGYRIKVYFSNEDSILSGNYIETGYIIRETVTDSNIISTFTLY